jgi:hypothetical protein
MGSPLGGNHHIAGFGKHRQGVASSELAVLIQPDFILQVETTALFPAASIPVGSLYVAIWTISEAVDLRQEEEGFVLERTSIAMKASGVLNATVDVKVAALHMQGQEA